LKKAIFTMLPLLFCFIISSALAQSYPAVAEGEGFNIQGSVAFQHLPYVADVTSPGFTFTIEVLTGTLNGTDARLGMDMMGGTVSFHNNALCEIQLYADAPIWLVCTSEVSVTVTEHSWNCTLAADTDQTISWRFNGPAFIDTYWNLLILIGALIMLFAGVIMFAWAIREYKFNILDADTTMLGIISICLFIFGIGLTLYWLLG
jgi:hypothetical protein